jgi:hypothetical protein
MECPACHNRFDLRAGHMCNFITGGLRISPVGGWFVAPLSSTSTGALRTDVQS